MHARQDHQARGPRMGAQRGFTLLELMIAVAIIAILAVVAYPSYEEFIKRSRRSDAMSHLLKISNQQEIFFSNNQAYTSSLANLGMPAASEEGHYTVAINTPSSITYTITATPVPGGPQDGDGSLRITSAGVKQWDKANNSSWGYDWSDR